MLSLWTDPRCWFWIFIGIVWLRRSMAALRALHTAPVVNPAFKRPAKFYPKVSVIIPAKNEEKNIGECIRLFLAQDYPNFEIIVANDNSKDQTESILKSFGDKIRYVNVSPTPQGWTGKNFAVHSALSLAQGDWFLFTDADTRHHPSSISASVSHAESQNLSFLTLLPECLTNGAMENIFQPAMMGFVGLWFPIDQMNDPKSPLYFANGQYMLISADLHHELGGHQNVRDQFLEDFALMSQAKARGEKTQVALGMDIYGTRMYESFGSLWRGWRRIFLHAFRKNTAVIFSKFLDVFLTSLVPTAIVISGFIWKPQGLLHTVGFWGLSVIMMIWIMAVVAKTYGIVKARRRYFIFFPAAALILCLILLNAAWIAGTGRKTKWR